VKKGIAGFVAGVMVTLLLSPVISGASGLTQQVTATMDKGIGITWNGKAFTPTGAGGAVIYPLVYNGTSYLPLRAIAEKAGIEVRWDSDTRTIALTHTSTGSEPWEGMTLDDSIMTGPRIGAAVTTERCNGSAVRWVDRDKLPERIKGFTQISVTGFDREWTEEIIAWHIEEVIKHNGRGVAIYNDEDGYGTATYKNTVLILWDNNLNPLAYYIIK
jgi:hypothetical protein